MQTEYLSALNPDDSAAIDRGCELLRAGEVVAFPTETVYGLGADARNAAAIAKVFEAKGRPADNPLIVHVADAEWLRRCSRASGRTAEQAAALAAALLPGPLTLVLPSDPSIPSIARAGLPSVALRIPAHPVALALIERAGPLVAPSANRSGRPSPTTAAHVLDDLAGRIAAVIDGGACAVGIESTVLDLCGDRPVVLRPGAIAPETIAAVLGEPILMRDLMDPAAAPRAPGMKYRHYAPMARVVLLLAAEAPTLPLARGGRIVLTTPRALAAFPGEDVRPLDARTLYAVFREADEIGVDEIVIHAAPHELDAGLMDRIVKAAERMTNDE